MKKGYVLAIGLALVITLTLWETVAASGRPEEGLAQNDADRVGLLSTEVTCLGVQSGIPHEVSGTVRLQWTGQIERAFLVLSASGSRGAHSIYVNGQRVAKAPVRPGGTLCQPQSPGKAPGPSDMLPIPVEVLKQGENVITLTNDANVYDRWTASNLHIEIHGVLNGPPVAALKTPPSPAPVALSLRADTPISSSVLLTSSYELAHGRELQQMVWYQVPALTDTNGISIPLIISIHAMGGSGESARDFLAAEANARGWLLAAPDMHGSYYINDGRYALAWPGAQHDIIDTIVYMMSEDMMSTYEYEVDPSRIYIAGGSMGGQTTTMMAAKYPDLFPAAIAWKPLTDLSDWYYEIMALTPPDPYGDAQRIRNETGGRPPEVPFEYERRSPMALPQNSRLIPLKLWHDVDDILVPIHHSRDLKAAIDSWGPITPVILIEIASGDNTCPPSVYEHCYKPDPAEVFDYLEDFALSAQPPISLTIRTDEPKPYYWLDFVQKDDDHWSEVQSAYSLADKTVTTTVVDTQTLTLAFNLGSTPMPGTAGVYQPGMGLPATTYLVNGGGNYKLEDYVSGYLTTNLSTTGQYTFTISAIQAELAAGPAMMLGWETTTSTITATFKDQLDHPIPDGTNVQFSTTEGVFANARTTFTTTIVADGQVATVLTLSPQAGLATVTARVESVTGSTSVWPIHPALEVQLIPAQPVIYGGQAVTFTYQLTNSGDITLTQVTLVDDNGTPGEPGDDLTIWADLTLASGETVSHQRSVSLDEDTTNTVSANGQDPLGNDLGDDDAASVKAISPALKVAVTPSQDTIYAAQAVTYTYRLTNTGDVTLTHVTLVDDNGTPGETGDDLTICADLTLTAGMTVSYQRITSPGWDITSTVTVTGQDILENAVSDGDSTTVEVISPMIEVTISPHQPVIYSGQAVTFTYKLTNTGDVTLTHVTLVDDNGTPGHTGDDLTICTDLTLTKGETMSYHYSVLLDQDTTRAVTVSSQDSLGNDVSDDDSASVEVISPALQVAVTPSQDMVYGGQSVTYTYQLTNTGDVTLSHVTLVDDNGTPGDTGDDLMVCTIPVLTAEEMTSCHRSTSPGQDTISTVTATGQDPLGNDVSDDDSTTVEVISPAIEVAIASHPTLVIHESQAVTYTYRLTNTGDVTLTHVTLVDDNGTPKDDQDDLTICANVILTMGGTANYHRSTILSQTMTNTVTVSGQDPLGNDVSDYASTTVSELPFKVYLPSVVRND